MVLYSYSKEVINVHLNPQKLSEKRKAQRYSQRQLAAAANVPYSAVSNMEAGRVKNPKFQVITAIASVLEEDPTYFFDPAAV